MMRGKSLRAYERLPFRLKISLMTGLAVAGALGLALAGLLGLQWWSDHEQANQRHRQAAAIIAANIAPALLFGDSAVAKESIASARGIGDILWIDVRDGNGTILASYSARPGARTAADAWNSSFDYPVEANGDRVGTLQMGVRYRTLGDILKANAFVALQIFAVAFLLVLAFSRMLTQTAFRPIDKLTAAMRQIGDSGTYSLRLEPDSDPDFAAIGNSFNAMLGEIERGNARLVETADDLRNARDEAEQANLAKSQFLANMSHELRTPLNAIIGYAEILREELAAAAMTRSVEDIGWIHNSAHQLLALINSLLDLSKIEAGRMDLDIYEFDPRQVLDEISGMLEPVAAQRGNALSILIDPSVKSANTDATKLRQCLLNLVSNACKFTENGQIFILVRAEGDNLIFSVSDTGIGMARDELDGLFEPFVQADATTTRRYGGTGLGLTITWRFAEMLGGTVDVDSTPGAGSTFTLTIKRNLRSVTEWGADDAMAQLSNARDVNASQPLALIIEDEPSAKKLLSRLADQAGYRVLTAGDGESGLHLARQHRPDLITLDLGLPRTDGWQVLSEMEGDPALNIIPTVVVTVDDDRRRTLEAGAADHLVKPVNRDEMNDILALYANKRAGRILIADDDAATAALYDRGLAQLGYTTRIATSGSAAQRALSEEHFAFVITDLRMPDGDGFDLIEHINRLADAVRPKVIVITGKVLDDEESRRLDGKIVRLMPKNGLSPRKLAGNVHRALMGSFQSLPQGCAV